MKRLFCGPPALCAIALGSLCSSALGAEEPSLDPLIVSVGRGERTSLELPASASVVSRREIDEATARVNASEALARVAGLTAANRQNYAQDLQIASRGFGARSAFGVRGLRLYTDGIPATMPDGQGQAATFDLDVAERIEVLRGPYSVLFGNHAGGVVQLFTRDPEGEKPSFDSRLVAGSYGSWKADANALGRFGAVAYLVDSSRFASDGYRRHSAVTRDQGLVKLKARIEGLGRFTMVLNQLSQNDTEDPLGLTWETYLRDPRAAESPAFLFNTRKSIDHRQAGLRFEGEMGRGRFDVAAYLGDRAVIQHQSIPQAPQNSPRSPGGVIDFDRQFGGFDARWSLSSVWGYEGLSTTLGLSYGRSRDDRRGFLNHSEGNLGVTGALRRKEIDRVDSLDPYLQIEWLREPWEITAGLRHNRIKFKVQDQYLGNGDDSGAVRYRELTGMLGGRYHLGAHAFVYLSAARGLETPTLNELFYSGSGAGFNFGLRAARSDNLEVGMKSMLAPGFRADLAVFEVRTRDELVVDAASGGRTSYRNAARTLRQGAELSLQAALGAGLTSTLAVSALRAHYDQGFQTPGGSVAAGNRLPAVPAVSGFVDLVWRDRSQQNVLALEMQGRGRIFVEDRNLAQAAPGYAILNLRAGTSFQAGAWAFRPFVRVENVLNRKYIGSVIVGDANGRYYEPSPGRSWFLGLDCRWH